MSVQVPPDGLSQEGEHSAATDAVAAAQRVVQLRAAAGVEGALLGVPGAEPGRGTETHSGETEARVPVTAAGAAPEDTYEHDVMICPWCGHKHRDMCEFDGEDGEMDCDKCETKDLN